MWCGRERCEHGSDAQHDVMIVYGASTDSGGIETAAAAGVEGAEMDRHHAHGINSPRTVSLCTGRLDDGTYVDLTEFLPKQKWSLIGPRPPHTANKAAPALRVGSLGQFELVQGEQRRHARQIDLNGHLMARSHLWCVLAPSMIMNV